MTETDFRIRRGKLSDYPKAEEIWKAVGVFISFDRNPIYKTLVKSKFQLLLLAEAGERTLGAVNAFYRTLAGYIHHLGVHPDCQRHGIGSMLLTEMCKQLKERKVRLVILFTAENNSRDERAKFYERNGFKRVGKMFIKKL